MKLHQLVAIVTGRKPQVQRAITDLYQKLGNEGNFNGFNRVYKPFDDEGENLPDEKKPTVSSTGVLIGDFVDQLGPLMDLVASQDLTNCTARAPIVVDGTTLVDNVPVTTLMYLEKQLVDLRTFVSKLPVLNQSKQWSEDHNNDRWVAEPEKSFRTKKVIRNHVKAPATEHHPAQVETYYEDVNIGTWTKTEFSTAIPASHKQDYLNNVNTLIEAVKVAREEANSIEARETKIGAALLGYVFA